jgi:hypothetical protein
MSEERRGCAAASSMVRQLSRIGSVSGPTYTLRSYGKRHVVGYRLCGDFGSVNAGGC